MLKKTLLALGVAWTGTAMAASSGLDDVTMNIVNETAFEQIITASPAEIEKLLQDGNAKPVRTITLRNFDGANFTAGTPLEGQVFTVSKELNQGMVSFSFICSEDKEACEKRVQELSSTNGFTLAAPVGPDGKPLVGVGAGVQVIGTGGAGLHVFNPGEAGDAGPTFVQGEPGTGVFVIDGAAEPVEVIDFDGAVGGAVRVFEPASGQ